jgi:hypothetical protein
MIKVIVTAYSRAGEVIIRSEVDLEAMMDYDLILWNHAAGNKAAVLGKLVVTAKESNDEG